MVAQRRLVPLPPHKNQLFNQNDQTVLISKVTTKIFSENSSTLQAFKDQNASEAASVDKQFSTQQGC